MFGSGGAPLGISNQSLYLTLRCKGALTVLLGNGDERSCKLRKISASFNGCFLPKLTSVAGGLLTLSPG